MAVIINPVIFGGGQKQYVKSGSKVSISYTRTGGGMGNGNKQLYAWYELY